MGRSLRSAPDPPDVPQRCVSPTMAVMSWCSKPPTPWVASVRRSSSRAGTAPPLARATDTVVMAEHDDALGVAQIDTVEPCVRDQGHGLRPMRGLLVAFGVAVAGFAVYGAVTLVGASSRPRAVRHAEIVLRWEHRLGLDHERWLQAAMLDHPWLVAWSNAYYAFAYWPWVVGTLIALRAVNIERFRVCRDTLLLSGAVGLIIYIAFPLAPPRMLDGFVDTIHQSGQATLAHPEGLTNEHTAMPSFHVGWMVMCGVAAMPLVPRRAKWLLAVPGGLMFPTVVVTANHYVVDGLAGIALGLAALAAAVPLGRWRDATRSRSGLCCVTAADALASRPGGHGSA